MQMRVISFLLSVLFAHVAAAQSESVDMTCVEDADMRVFLDLAKAHKCLAETPPRVTMDSITIVLDRAGRVFSSGTSTSPLTMELRWCNYTFAMTTTLQVVTAHHVEPDWGFEPRLKAAGGVLVGELLRGAKAQDTVDAGLLLEPIRFKAVNANVYLGLRSFGLGIGVDLTRNFGVAGLFAYTWGTWRGNPLVVAYFGF
jgi:hypothetical protein